MNDRMVAFRIGVMILASLVVAVILGVLFGDWSSVWKSTYTVEVTFPEAPKVVRMTPVTKSGIVIGHVARVELMDQGQRVKVRLAIDSHQQIFSDEVCRINRTLLGDAELEFFKVPREGPAREIQLGGDPLDGVVTPSPLKVVGNLEGNLNEAFVSITDTSRKLGVLAERLDQFLGSEEEVDEKKAKLAGVFDQISETMSSVQLLADNANSVFGDEQTRRQLKTAIARMPQVLEDAQAFVGRLDHTANLLDENLENMRGFTGALDEQGGQIVMGLSNAMELLATFGENLNNPDGAVGKLLQDPELYDSLQRVVANLEELTFQLRPILNNVQVFTDKIARHPEQIGLRGMVSPSDGTKGLPPVFRSGQTPGYSGGRPR